VICMNGYNSLEDFYRVMFNTDGR